MEELIDSRMKDYLGIDDEYELFVDPESFDYDKFNPSWLKNYSDDLLEKMAENEHMRPHIIKVLRSV